MEDAYDRDKEHAIEIPCPARGGQRLSPSRKPAQVQVNKTLLKKTYRVFHRTKQAKACIMGQAYIVGLRTKASVLYLDILASCRDMLEDGILLDNENAKIWVDKAVSQGAEYAKQD